MSAFTTEAELVASFCKTHERDFEHHGYTAYHETAAWDLLLAHRDGHQIGIEAKLKLNVKVLTQALPRYRFRADQGPDFRAVLVPADAVQNDLSGIAWALGINVLAHRVIKGGWTAVQLPAGYSGSEVWHPWFPKRREKLPEYVPDVTGGHSAPVQLSDWKIQAIKMLILVGRRPVHRADFRHLKLSPTRWLDPAFGYLARTDAGYVSCDRTPDLKAQHPTIWSEIEADFDKWAPAAEAGLLAPQPQLFPTEAP